MKRSTKVVTAVTSATLLSLGLAGPAMATTSGTSVRPGSSQAAGQSTVTVAELRAWITKEIDARLAWVDKVQAMVSASTDLSAQRKADITARLTKERTALVALKSAVATATTKAGVWAVVDAASARGELFFGHMLGRGHHQARPAGAWRCGDPAVTSAKPAKALAAVSKKGAAGPVASASAGSARFGTHAGWQTASFGHGFGQHSGHFGGHDSARPGGRGGR